MTQSVMDSGHPWHVFKVEESSISSTALGTSSENYMITKHEYLASTRSRCGRPSTQILAEILSESSPK